jgi:hypothetical protein
VGPLTHSQLRRTRPELPLSITIGKIEIEKLLAERRRHQGEAFRMRALMDEFDVAGLIPASLLRWELTGQMPDDVGRMLASAP